MPHVHIKHFPRNFTAEQEKRLAQAITTAVLENFDTHDGAVSIVREPVAKADWNEAVTASELTECEHSLIKKPNYLEK